MPPSYISDKEIKPEPQTCVICLEEVDADDKINGIPNCVTCDNGHFIHRECFDKMTTRLCPSCREPIERNCSGYHGYFKPNRKGGIKKKKTIKKRKNVKKTIKERKSNKRYTRKSIKSIK